MKVRFAVESTISRTPRVRQLGSMFDCPVEEKSRLTYDIDFPIEAQPWNVGLIVGPSGSGKSSVLRHVFGEQPALTWAAGSLIDDFDKKLPMEDIAAACQAVGFNTIPAWMRPHAVLSNGEQFRVDLARRVLELPDPIVVDEFTSVVDRQVAQIGSHAVQKFVRRRERQFVAVTCHYDVIDWLQPDWVLDMATRSFTRRSLQRRPELDITIGRIPYAAWRLFAPFHYMSADLHRAARCFGLWCNGRLAAMIALLHRPHATAHDIMGISRGVTLPDFQGLGLIFHLQDHISAAYKAIGKRVHAYPAHPSHVRNTQRNKNWRQVKEAGTFDSSGNQKSTIGNRLGGSACATFAYCGTAMDKRQAERLLAV